jgi:hypothetical protein
MIKAGCVLTTGATIAHINYIIGNNKLERKCFGVVVVYFKFQIWIFLEEMEKTGNRT